MIKYKMTNDIAFELGAFNYPCFYDWAIRKDTDDFEYENFFVWNGEYGHLDESKFETLEHKFYYIKGRLSSYSVGIEDDKITVVYANSIKSRDRFIKWMNELLMFDFGKNESWSIEKTDGDIHTVPSTPGLILKADKEIINYYTNGEKMKFLMLKG